MILFYVAAYGHIRCPRHFYRAMLCIRGTRYGPVSVSVSVCHKSVFY